MKKYILFILLVFLLAGCSQKITEENLIEGKWIATAGYDNDEVTGEPDCYPFEEGLEFIDEKNVYNESYERNFEYLLIEEEITFFDLSKSYSYKINKISENEIIFEGLYTHEGNNCVLERK